MNRAVEEYLLALLAAFALAAQAHTGTAGYPDTPVIVNNTPAKFKTALLEAKARAQELPPGLTLAGTPLDAACASSKSG